MRVAMLQRDLLFLDAELKAAREARRTALLAAAAVSLVAAGMLFLFWITMGLHEAGWSSWTLAVASLLFFSLLGGALGMAALKGLKTHEARQTDQRREAS